MNVITEDTKSTTKPTPGSRASVDGELAFLALTYLLALAIALCFPGSEDAPGPAAVLTLFAPAAAIGATKLFGFRRNHRPPLGLRRLAIRAWPRAISLPVMAVSTAVGASYAIGVIGFHELPQYIASAPLTIAMLAILVLGEEIGWRGFLFPSMTTHMPVRRAAILCGLAHGAFHIPLLLMTSAYDVEGSRALVTPGVVGVVTAGGIVFGWLRATTGSLWPVAIAHAAVNTCFLSSPVLVTSHPDTAAHLSGEGGIFTLLTVSAVGIWILVRASWAPDSRARSARENAQAWNARTEPADQ
jgi:uncharacterized protein